jgi:hypothetical protein
MSPWQKRLIEEHAQLRDRLVLLMRFLDDTANWRDKPPRDMALLVAQQKAMELYLAILAERVELIE